MKSSIIRIRFLVVSMYGASLANALNLRDAFWQISSMRLLNFNLQSKNMPSSFSLRELFMCKPPILSVLTCSSANMPTCLVCLRAKVPCVLANVLTRSLINVPCMPTRSRAITSNKNNYFNDMFYFQKNLNDMFYFCLSSVK